MKALVGSFNQALVGAFSVIVKTGCGTDGALHSTTHYPRQPRQQMGCFREADFCPFQPELSFNRAAAGLQRHLSVSLGIYLDFLLQLENTQGGSSFSTH